MTAAAASFEMLSGVGDPQALAARGIAVKRWRREWDSNPRYGVAVHTLSKRAP
jgi:hypothetical protein